MTPAVALRPLRSNPRLWTLPSKYTLCLSIGRSYILGAPEGASHHGLPPFSPMSGLREPRARVRDGRRTTRRARALWPDDGPRQRRRLDQVEGVARHRGAEGACPQGGSLEPLHAGPEARPRAL